MNVEVSEPRECAASVEGGAVSGRHASAILAIQQARRQSDRIFRVVRKDWLHYSAIPLRHPAIFYWGHLEAFDLNLIELALRQSTARDTSWDRLFAFGVDPANASALDAREWPAAPAVWKYVQNRRRLIDRLLPLCEPRVLSMCLEHRLMHIETLIYLLHQMPYHARHAVIGFRRPRTSEGVAIEMVDVPAGEAALGAQGADEFVWDNERGGRSHWEPSFRVSRTKVTNGQYLDFVRAGGPVPAFWRIRGGRFNLQGFHFEMPLPLDWPVYVSHENAKAFAEWRGASLPSEAQFSRYSEATASSTDSRRFTLFDCDPISVWAQPTQSAHGVQQCFSNGWEWTRDPFQPLGAFQPDPLYPGYSEPFFGADHSVLKGASPATPPRLARPSFRNWFRNDYPYAYTAFRLVSAD